MTHKQQWCQLQVTKRLQVHHLNHPTMCTPKMACVSFYHSAAVVIMLFSVLSAAQDNFLQTVASDWRYERALQGIRLLAQHHVGQLVHAIIAWRQAVNEDIKKNYSTNNVVNMQGICKRVSTRHASYSASPSSSGVSAATITTTAVHQQEQEQGQQ
jgi:hypothetical protein